MKVLFSALTAILLIPYAAAAQTSFDKADGCLNVVNVTRGWGIGEYGSGIFSAEYLHEMFIADKLSVGGGIGYSYHEEYKLSALPVYVSSHYFFLDSRFSPFVNLCVGGFGVLGKKNVDTYNKYSISSKPADFNLFVSPAIGVKAHIAPSIGIMAAVSNDMYLLKAYDTKKQEYRGKLVSGLGVSIGVFFQIEGW